MRRDFVSVFAAAAVVFACANSWAQLLSDPDPNWKEVEVPPPPQLRTGNLVPIELLGGGTELSYAIDPQSVAVGRDGVVRYVVVASSRSGAVNAMYEGVRCDRAEYRVYARSSGQGWRPVETEWKTVFDGVEARHVRALAQAGVCRGRSANGGPEQIVRDLRTPFDRKFGGSSAP